MTTHKQYIANLDEVAAHSRDADTQTACIVVDATAVSMEMLLEAGVTIRWF